MVDTDGERHTTDDKRRTKMISQLFLIVMVDTDDTRQTTPQVWHKLPTGELKSWGKAECSQAS